MALIKCKECGNEISSQAKTCPQCGHPTPKRTSTFTWIVAAFIVFAVLQATFRTKTPATSPTPEQTALNAKKDEEDFKRQDAARLAVAMIKSYSKNPSSVKIEALASNKDATLICAMFRATNSFNAVVPGSYVMKNGKQSFDGNEVTRSCGKNQASIDMMFTL